MLSVLEINRDASATLTVTEDGMQALLSIEPAQGNGNPITRESIKTLLTEIAFGAGVHKPASRRR